MSILKYLVMLTSTVHSDSNNGFVAVRFCINSIAMYIPLAVICDEAN